MSSSVIPWAAPARPSISRQQVWWLWYAAVLGLTALLGLAMFLRGPHEIYPALLAVGFGVAALLYNPRLGVYGIVFLTLVGDSRLLPWYPFAKNLSSRESLLFIHDALIFSPLEAVLILTLFLWLARAALWRQKVRLLGTLLWPVGLFAVTLVLGFIYGVARGGNVNIALWEVRAVFYMPVMLALTCGLLTRREHWQRLLWIILAALFVEGVVGAYAYLFVLNRQVPYGSSIIEHSAAIQMNILFIATLAAWVYGASRQRRVLLLLMVLPVGLTYLVAQRRAAIIALVVALLLLAFVLYHLKPRAFWRIAPAGLLLSALYLTLFWNTSGMLGMPARAIRTVVAPAQASLRDQRSKVYRDLENINILFTIKQAPLTGIGFGQRFHRLVPLPDISFFVWYEYITHNAILWIWMKAGLAGFFALLFMIGWTVSSGARTLFLVSNDNERILALVALLYVIMHFVFAYVDMAWDTQSMLCLGAMMGILSRLEGSVADAVRRPAQGLPGQAVPLSNSVSGV